MRPETKVALRSKLAQIKSLIQARRETLGMYKDAAEQKQGAYLAIKEDLDSLKAQRDAVEKDLEES